MPIATPNCVECLHETWGKTRIYIGHIYFFEFWRDYYNYDVKNVVC